MKLIKKIKDYFGYLRFSFKYSIIWDKLYLNFMTNPVKETIYNEPIINAIEKYVNDFIKKNNIETINVSFDEINKNILIEGEKVVGRFIYTEKLKNYIANKLINNEPVTPFPIILTYDYGSNFNKNVPRIELTEKANIFTTIHELGHYDIFIKGNEQSEKLADYYLYPFLKENLPECFLWVLQISIKVKCDVELTFTKKEVYNYYKELNKICDGR